MQEQRRSIFIVDDEEPTRNALKTHLTNEGYRVIQSDGNKGVFEKLKDTSYELLICGMKMPEVDGVDVLEFSRVHSRSTPVIMLTGVEGASEAADVVKRGAFGCVSKPVKKEDLLGAIRKAFDYRDSLLGSRRLEVEKGDLRLVLEQKVEESTMELRARSAELEADCGLLKSMNIQFVSMLAEMVEVRDRYTKGHCNRMRFLCVEMGRLAGLTPEEMEALEYASLLHDLGKIGVDETILNKQGPLTGPECSVVKEHTEIGERMLRVIPCMETVARTVVSHHESYDGTGYPQGLKGVDIPVSSRIIAVADAYDAMSSDRPYRKGLGMEVVIDEIRRVAGTQLDPDLVKIFINNRVYFFIKN